MDRVQFTTLIKGEQESLRRYLLALCCGDKDEADDIAQEALVKAYFPRRAIKSGASSLHGFTALLTTHSLIASVYGAPPILLKCAST